MAGGDDTDYEDMTVLAVKPKRTYGKTRRAQTSRPRMLLSLDDESTPAVSEKTKRSSSSALISNKRSREEEDAVPVEKGGQGQETAEDGDEESEADQHTSRASKRARRSLSDPAMQLDAASAAPQRSSSTQPPLLLPPRDEAKPRRKRRSSTLTRPDRKSPRARSKSSSKPGHVADVDEKATALESSKSDCDAGPSRKKPRTIEVVPSAAPTVPNAAPKRGAPRAATLPKPSMTLTTSLPVARSASITSMVAPSPHRHSVLGDKSNLPRSRQVGRATSSVNEPPPAPSSTSQSAVTSSGSSTSTGRSLSTTAVAPPSPAVVVDGPQRRHASLEPWMSGSVSRRSSVNPQVDMSRVGYVYRDENASQAASMIDPAPPPPPEQRPDHHRASPEEQEGHTLNLTALSSALPLLPRRTGAAVLDRLDHIPARSPSPILFPRSRQHSLLISQPTFAEYRPVPIRSPLRLGAASLGAVGQAFGPGEFEMDKEKLEQVYKPPQPLDGYEIPNEGVSMDSNMMIENSRSLEESMDLTGVVSAEIDMGGNGDDSSRGDGVTTGADDGEGDGDTTIQPFFAEEMGGGGEKDIEQEHHHSGEEADTEPYTFPKLLPASLTKATAPPRRRHRRSSTVSTTTTSEHSVTKKSSSRKPKKRSSLSTSSPDKPLILPRRYKPLPVDPPSRNGPGSSEDDLAYAIRTTGTGEELSSSSSSDDEEMLREAEDEFGEGLAPGRRIKAREGDGKGKKVKREWRLKGQVLPEDEALKVEEGESDDELMMIIGVATREQTPSTGRRS